MRECHGLNVSPHQIPMLETLPTNVMILGGVALDKVMRVYPS